MSYQKRVSEVLYTMKNSVDFIPYFYFSKYIFIPDTF